MSWYDHLDACLVADACFWWLMIFVVCLVAALVLTVLAVLDWYLLRPFNTRTDRTETRSDDPSLLSLQVRWQALSATIREVTSLLSQSAQDRESDGTDR